MSEQKQGPSIAERYHDATKYTPEGIASSRRELDWEKKPSLFKSYEGATRVALVPSLIGRQEGTVSLADAESAVAVQRPAPPSLALEDLARLLYLTNGVTRIVPQPSPFPGSQGEPFCMRAAPSAGGLYPTEIYVVRGEGAAAPLADALPEGAWNLNVRELSLVSIGEGPAEASRALARIADATGVPALVRRAEVVLVLSGVFERSGWRYEERAYRRVCLDTGHVLGNLVLAAARLGHVALPIGGFHDAEVEAALGIAPASGRIEEGPLVVVPIFRPEDLDPRPLRGALALKGRVVPASEVDESPGLMRALHAATRLEPPLERAYGRDAPGDAFQEQAQGAALSLPETALDWSDGALERTIVRRRSTRAFTADPFSLAEIAGILGGAYLTPGSPLLAALGAGEAAAHLPACFVDASLLETFVVVTRSSDAEPGVYRFDPRAFALRLVATGERSRQAHAICLGQELGRDAAAVVLHTVDLPRAIARYGDRAYRYVHLDAGHVGERIDLAALRLGLGASGIGGFFDDHANALLGLPVREGIVYITTLGRPAEEEPE